jgi:hypothetical protein
LDHEKTTSSAEREGDRVIPQQIHIFEFAPLRRAAKFDGPVSAWHNAAPVGKGAAAVSTSPRDVTGPNLGDATVA